MTDINEKVRKRLFDLQDTEYKNFHSRLMPTVDGEKIIGVRTPELRKLSKELWKDGTGEEFIKKLPHEYYEENNLHGFFIEQIKDYDKVTAELDRFLPYVDNWATCDLMKPKVLKKHTAELIVKIKEWISSNDTYTVRFGIKMLMEYYLDEHFSDEINELVSCVKSDEYYVNMVRAWYFATALAKQYDATIPYIQNRRLDEWTHSKTIQKAVESYRITSEQKAYLKTLK